MIKLSLSTFVDRIVENKRITASDVRELGRNVFPYGVTCREEADILIALDRAVVAADPAWGCYLTAALVEFSVWTSRPTGYIDQDTAQWLATTLACGSGPTDNAVQAAFEIVKEAQQVDQTLLAFVMGSSQRWMRDSSRDAVADSLAA